MCVCVCVCVLTNKACHKRLYFAVPLSDLGLTFKHPIVFGWLDACIGELPEDLPPNLPVKGRSKVSHEKTLGIHIDLKQLRGWRAELVHVIICALYARYMPTYAHYMSIICPHMPTICPLYAHYMSITCPLYVHYNHARFMLNSQIIDRLFGNVFGHVYSIVVIFM